MLALLLTAALALPATKNGDGNCGYWKEKYVAASRLSVGASGATPQLYGASTVQAGMKLDATSEYIYFMLHVDDADWQAGTDIVIKIIQQLNAAETNNDTIDGEVKCEYLNDHEDADSPKTQTRTVSHDITTNSGAGFMHKVVYVFDDAAADNNIEAGDRMLCSYRLTDVGAGHVAAVHVVEVALYYRTCYPAEPLTTFPSEG